VGEREWFCLILVCVFVCSGVHITHCLDCCVPAHAAWVLMAQTLIVNSKKLTFSQVLFLHQNFVFSSVYIA